MSLLCSAEGLAVHQTFGKDVRHGPGYGRELQTLVPGAAMRHPYFEDIRCNVQVVDGGAVGVPYTTGIVCLMAYDHGFYVIRLLRSQRRCAR